LAQFYGKSVPKKSARKYIFFNEKKEHVAEILFVGEYYLTDRKEKSNPSSFLYFRKKTNKIQKNPQFQ